MTRASPAKATRQPTVTFPDGTVVPDWGAITTPSAGAALEALFNAFIGLKWHGMDGAEVRVRRVVLQAYSAHGRAPTLAKIAIATGLPPDEIASALQRLAGRDLVILDGAGRVSEYRVDAGGVSMGAMCALDALGIGALLERGGIIRSACRKCRRALVIHTCSRGHALEHVAPAEIVLWSGPRYADGCAASSLCTLQAFFCDDDHLEAWRSGNSIAAQDGVRLSLPDALEIGCAIFAPMRRTMQPLPPGI
jgi:alkylmercury lyase